MTNDTRTLERRIRTLEGDLATMKARCATLEKFIEQLHVGRGGRQAMTELDDRVWVEINKIRRQSADKVAEAFAECYGPRRQKKP